MIYAQISGGVIINTIVLEQADLEPIFASRCDNLVRIDELSPMPSIGWAYDGLEFSEPNQEVSGKKIKKLMEFAEDPPGAFVGGEQYYNTSTGMVRYYNGINNEWIDL